MSRTCQQKKQIYTQKSKANAFIEAKAQHYLQPLEDKPLEQIDKRLVRTCSTLFKSILLFRNTKMGLLLSEEDTSLVTPMPRQAPSGLVTSCAARSGQPP